MNAEQFQHQTNVSRETLRHFEAWYNLLSIWNKKINLVSSATLHDFWLRHALDSWQIVELLPKNTKTIIDLGAGAGFPGLALAMALKNQPGMQEAGNGQETGNETMPAEMYNVDLVESNGKKSNFLRTVIRECDLPAKVIQDRVENLDAKPYDVITARAFAPLPKLLKYSLPFWSKDKSQQTTAIIPKGAKWQEEVDVARKRFDFDLITTNSQTSDEAKILTITNLRRKGK